MTSPASPAAAQRALDQLVRSVGRARAPLAEACVRAVLSVAEQPALSRATGWLADRHVPPPILRKAIDLYVRAYHVDLREVDAPLDSFDTFNAFFTRALRDGARPVEADPDVIVSPADARLSVIGHVPASGLLEQVKGRRYRIGGLLADEGAAAPYRGGVHALLYLSPRDYHRVHCPVDGTLVSWTRIPGRLLPVNGLAVDRVDGLFTVNERVVFHLDTPRFGPLALVMVGASNVSRITLSFPGAHAEPTNGAGPTTVRPSKPIPMKRGDELGVFNLGSTVVLLAADRKLEATAALAGEHVQMGRPLFRKLA